MIIMLESIIILPASAIHSGLKNRIWDLKVVQGAVEILPAVFSISHNALYSRVYVNKQTIKDILFSM